MKLFDSFFLLVMLVAVFACSGNNQKMKGGIISDLEASELSFQEISIEPMIGRPNQIEIVDSLLILTDFLDEKTLLLYNLIDSSYIRVLTVGQGPGEVLAPITIDVSGNDGTLCVLQRQNGKCWKYEIDSLIHGMTSNFEEVNLGEADRVTQINGGYACLGMYRSGILGIFDIHGDEKDYIDMYSKFKIQDVSDKYRLFQGRLAFNRSSDCLMIAPSYASNIWFYMRQGENWVKKDSFNLGGERFEERILHNTDFNLNRDDIRTCINVCESDKYFYVLYDGGDLGHTHVASFRYIIRFDALGQFDCVYKINSTISDICVSRDDVIMYALLIGKDGEYAIAKSYL